MPRCREQHEYKWQNKIQRDVSGKGGKSWWWPNRDDKGKGGKKGEARKGFLKAGLHPTQPQS